MTFSVSLEQFEGPLDLMLHLIKEKKLDLFNLDIVTLADQYAYYIKHSDTMKLEIVGDYLTELASLMELKSKSLLPKPKIEVEEEYSQEKLVARLLEYQRYKDVSELLRINHEQRSKQHTKPISDSSKWQSNDFDIQTIEGNPYDLMKAMNRCLRHLALNTYKETKYTVQEVSVVDMTEEIKEKYRNKKDSFTFTSMIQECDSLSKVIVYFLAILDLIHKGTLLYTATEDEIYLKWSNEDE